MFKSATINLATGAVLALAASTATADPIDFYSTTFDDGFTAGAAIRGNDGWVASDGFDRMVANNTWGSDDSWSASYTYSTNSATRVLDHHALRTDAAAVSERFQISVDMALDLGDAANFGHAGLYLSNTGSFSTGMYNNAMVRFERDGAAIRLSYREDATNWTLAGDDLSNHLGSDYFYTFALDVDPENRQYDLVVTRTQKSTATATQVLSLEDVGFRGGFTATSLATLGFVYLNTGATQSANTFYVDNIQIVPEPGALSLLAAGGVLVWRRPAAK